MAFNFGNTGQTGFGTNTAKPTAFGAPFGATTTTASTGFGFGSTFGSTPQQPAPAFGSAFGSSATPAFGTSTFGTPASSTPAFGSTFGTQQATATPAFGTAFGTQAAAGTSGGLFGSTTKPSLFSTPTTSTSLFSTPPTTNLFGAAPATTQATTGLFGATSTSTPSLFGQTTTPSLFGSSFGSTAPSSTGPSLFGSSGTTTGTGGFGLFGSSTTTTTAPSLFGGFGTTASTTTAQTGFGGFGTGSTGTGGFGTGGFGGFGSTTGTAPGLFGSTFGAKPPTGTIAVPQNIPQTQQQQNQLVLTSIYSINIFNDERDEILKKWNMLQACWGTGKGYYNANMPPVEYTVHNPFYRFKAVAYTSIPKHDNSEGLVKLVFNRKYSELADQKTVLINGISGILGNKANLKVIIQHIKTLSENQAEVRIVVSEKGITGSTRSIPATDLANYLNQPAQKQQLTNVGVTCICPYVTPSKASLNEYLNTTPLGFEPQMWKMGIEDNPNPEKFMPVPVYGFQDLKTRKLKQEYETGLHKAFAEKINNELTELRKKHVASLARINEFKLRFIQLQHKTLRILVKQESIRKAGLAIQPEEEYLKGKLEMLYAHLNQPAQFKGQLNELISTVRLMEHTTRPAQPKYKLVPENQAELKEFLQLQQKGIAKLVEIVRDDLQSLNIIDQGMRQIHQNRQLL